MGNAARKARKRAGIKFVHPQKTPTGYLGRPDYSLPVLPLWLMDAARSVWESKSFR